MDTPHQLIQNLQVTPVHAKSDQANDQQLQENYSKVINMQKQIQQKILLRNEIQRKVQYENKTKLDLDIEIKKQELVKVGLEEDLKGEKSKIEQLEKEYSLQESKLQILIDKVKLINEKYNLIKNEIEQLENQQQESTDFQYYDEICDLKDQIIKQIELATDQEQRYKNNYRKALQRLKDEKQQKLAQLQESIQTQYTLKGFDKINQYNATKSLLALQEKQFNLYLYNSQNTCKQQITIMEQGTSHIILSILFTFLGVIIASVI